MKKNTNIVLIISIVFFVFSSFQVSAEEEPSQGLRSKISQWFEDDLTKEVRLAAEGKSDVNAQIEGEPLLVRVIMYLHNPHLVARLIERGADVNVHNGDPLWYAIMQGNKEIIELLLDAGAQLTRGKDYYWRHTTFGRVLDHYSFDSDIADLFLSHDPTLLFDKNPKTGGTHLHSLVKNWMNRSFYFRLYALRPMRLEDPLLFSQYSHKALYDLVKEDSEIAYWLADVAKEKYGVEKYKPEQGQEIKVVKKLLAEETALFDIVYPKTGKTLQHMMWKKFKARALVEKALAPVENDEFKKIEYILKKGVDVNAKDNKGRTADQLTPSVFIKEIIQAYREGRESRHKQMHDDRHPTYLGKASKVLGPEKEIFKKGFAAAKKKFLQKEQLTPDEQKVLTSFAKRVGGIALVIASLSGVAYKKYTQKQKDEFVDAARQGDLSKIQNWLAKGMDINAKDLHGDTALIAAMIRHHANVMNYLLAQPKIDVNKLNSLGYSPLVVTILDHKRDIRNTLLQRSDINVNLQDPRGETALMYAVRVGSGLGVLDVLNHPKIDVRIKNKAGQTALDIARSRPTDAWGYRDFINMIEQKMGQQSRQREAAALMVAAEQARATKAEGAPTGLADLPPEVLRRIMQPETDVPVPPYSAVPFSEELRRYMPEVARAPEGPTVEPAAATVGGSTGAGVAP